MQMATLWHPGSMPDDILTHREEQRRLYGEPLSEIVGRITSRLDLTQARVADVLGLSAPMLSQLVSGRRVKIGNPLVVERLRDLHELAGRTGTLDLAAEIERIKDAESVITTSRGSVTAADVVIVLAAAASPDALRRAAAAVEDEPALATLLLRAAQADA